MAHVSVTQGNMNPQWFHKVEESWTWQDVFVHYKITKKYAGGYEWTAYKMGIWDGTEECFGSTEGFALTFKAAETGVLEAGRKLKL